MGASRTAPMGSIRRRALEAVLMLMDVENAVDETRDAACQTSPWDHCINADQTRSCCTRAEDIATLAVTYAGNCTGLVMLAASKHTPSVPEEQLVPSSIRDQAKTPTNFQEHVGNTVQPLLPSL